MRAPKEHVDSIVSNAQWRHPALHAAAIEMVRRAMLEAAEAGAKAMRIAAMTALAVGPYEEGGDEYAIIAALDPLAVASRAVAEQDETK